MQHSYYPSFFLLECWEMCIICIILGRKIKLWYNGMLLNPWLHKSYYKKQSHGSVTKVPNACLYRVLGVWVLFFFVVKFLSITLLIDILVWFPNEHSCWRSMHMAVCSTANAKWHGCRMVCWQMLRRFFMFINEHFSQLIDPLGRKLEKDEFITCMCW